MWRTLRATLLLAAGSVAGLGGVWALLYARDHAPSPGADPWAEKILSAAAHTRLEAIGWTLAVLGALLFVLGFIDWLRAPP